VHRFPRLVSGPGPVLGLAVATGIPQACGCLRWVLVVWLAWRQGGVDSRSGGCWVALMGGKRVGVDGCLGSLGMGCRRGGAAGPDPWLISRLDGRGVGCGGAVGGWCAPDIRGVPSWGGAGDVESKVEVHPTRGVVGHCHCSEWLVGKK
jgi:hypothetical protein